MPSADQFERAGLSALRDRTTHRGDFATDEAYYESRTRRARGTHPSHVRLPSRSGFRFLITKPGRYGRVS